MKTLGFHEVQTLPVLSAVQLGFLSFESEMFSFPVVC